MQEIRPLTSLRGIFACWVVILHIFIAGLQWGTDTPWIVIKGYLAVDFFFFLSGFILAATYGPMFLGVSARNHYLPFIIRRWGRLFPLHIAIVLVIVIIHPIYPVDRIIEELTLTQRWHLWPPADGDWINLPSWSISTEWAASLVFPLFVLAALGGSNIRAAFAGTVFGALLIYADADHGWNLNIWRSSVTILPMLRCFGDFGLGLVAFRYREASPFLKSDRCLVLLIALFFIAMGLHASDLVVVAIIFPIVTGIAGNSGRVAATLSSRPLHWLGMVSYSIYLTHYSLVLALRFLLSGSTTTEGQAAIYIIATVITTLIVSAATYHLIEVPARNWVKKLLDVLFKIPSVSQEHTPTG